MASTPTFESNDTATHCLESMSDRQCRRDPAGRTAGMRDQECCLDKTCILLVEDEFLIRLLLTESLSDAGFTVIPAENGDMAIRLLNLPGQIDLLLTDISMTGAADGNKVAQVAKRRNPRLPVIYATGQPDSLSNLISPDDALIRKPYSPAQLMIVIRRLLEVAGD